MRSANLQWTATACVATAILAAGTIGTAEAAPGPREWLDRMAAAVRGTNYEGTVIRMQGGTVEALKVVHVVAEGVVHEKVIVQEGNGLEIIRNGNEVQCILPDEKSVLVEEWNDQSALFASVPSSDIDLGSEYDVAIVRTERVAGRKTVLLAIRPHDGYRFAHRIWLDTETGFPLQTKLIGDDGSLIGHVKFADIRINQKIQPSALAPTISTENFHWFTNPKRNVSPAVETRWVCDKLPSGFRVVSSHQEEVPGNDAPVTHILYSDGLANVSVFIARTRDKQPAHPSRVGASNSYSSQIDDYQVTAVGEVPAETVKQIAKSMRRSE
jgi:sigma-E factor negative regulatory protein RseB